MLKYKSVLCGWVNMLKQMENEWRRKERPYNIVEMLRQHTKEQRNNAIVFIFMRIYTYI